MNDLNGNYAKVANSITLTLLARSAMILATLVLPVAGWMLQRSINTIDLISTKVDTIRDQTIETGSAIKLIQQSQVIQGQIISDHEARVRMLEAFARTHPTVFPPP